MPKYLLDIHVSIVTGHQTYSVKARNKKDAIKKFMAFDSMTFESEEIEVESLQDVEKIDLVDIYEE